MRVVVVGEILWDVFVDGERLGGAPFNFAVQASRLGHEVNLISAVGEDTRGHLALEKARALGLSVELIGVTKEHPTGWVSVFVDELGYPDYTLHRPAAYDAATLDAQALESVARLHPSWICFGTLHSMDPRAYQLTQALIETNPKALRLYDVNLRKNSYKSDLVEKHLHTSDLVKVNEQEAIWLSNQFGLTKSWAEFCHETADRFNCRVVCVTLGEGGCCLLNAGKFVKASGHSVDVADTVGAGDAFTAGLIHGIDQDWPIEQVAKFANRMGSLAAGRKGALPSWSLEELGELE